MPKKTRRRSSIKKRHRRIAAGAPEGGRRRKRTKRRRSRGKQRGGAWGPGPLLPTPYGEGYGPFTGNQQYDLDDDEDRWKLFSDHHNAIKRIIRAINDCHPGGCPGPDVAAPVLLPVANPIPPPPDYPPPSGGRRTRRTKRRKRRKRRKRS